MFTTINKYSGHHASPDPIGTIRLGSRIVTLSHRGMNRVAARCAAGEAIDKAVEAVLYGRDGEHRDHAFDIVGWWTYRGRTNPWRMIGRVQITRTIEYGEIHYCATSLITDHCSKTLPHLISRLTVMQFGAAKREREKARKPKRRYRRVESEGEAWARRREEGWGPGGY